jgi:outer membrane protein OmpA-like peptidoglycan-associated protein
MQAIKSQEAKCEQRMTVVADALFEFDKATLTKDAEQTSDVLGPLVNPKAGKHPVTARVTRTSGGKKRPVAPNAKPDGTDDPDGRQKNRRVEIVTNTCQ